MYKVEVRTKDRPLSFDDVVSFHYNGKLLVLKMEDKNVLLNTNKLIFVEIYYLGEE